jgi:hypothetical protein
MKNVESEDYRDRPCTNCPGRGCRYGNVYRKALIVYKVTITRTGKYYIGATLQTLKKWVVGHLQRARQFLRNGTRSSTLAIHLAQRMWQRSSNSIPSAGVLHDELSCSILWQGDPFSCSKTFGKVVSEGACHAAPAFMDG